MSYAGTISGMAERPRRAGLGRWFVVAAVLLPLAALIAAGVLLKTSKAEINASPTALAKITLPLGGGKIEHVIVARALDQRGIPARISGGVITPTGLVRAGERVTITATVRRPGWNAWLTGATQRLKLTVTTPSSRIRSRYVTLNHHEPLRVAFAKPVQVVELGEAGGRVRRIVFARPQTHVTIPTHAVAGQVLVAGVPRVWERSRPTFVSWFPGGASATAVARPAPGTSITPHTPITLTFSKPVSKVFGKSLPPVSPAGSGQWRALNSHAIQFVPAGYGYGLAATVVVGLPADVNLVGGTPVGSDPQGRWSVPAGSTTRLQQLLAGLGYLPVTFTASGAAVANTMAAQETAAVDAPQGNFSWRYQNTPSDLVSAWQAGSSGELTKGAVMAFENDQGMTPDGVAGPQVWKALIAATVAGKVSNFGYTYVNVSEGSPESVDVWHNGKNVVTGPVNTGVPAAPTAQGTFAVFEHLTVTTMTGTNPDGSHYSDPGIPWVSYFNGGDALHGFIRASYGFPQSDGCVEMPYAQAAQVWPYTPIGTIVHVY
jgi:peptidoglycan hydrolase-like protein with peptidoglycan-binding domain